MEINNLFEHGCKITNCIFGQFNWIRLGSVIKNSEIGNDNFIGFRCVIENLEIGNNVQIASLLKIIGKKKTKICNEVWIGANVTIESGVNIGTGTIIGANSTIYKDIPSFSIVYGNKDNLVIKRRIYEDDGLPNFRNLLRKKIWSSSITGSKFDNNNNYIDSDFTHGSKFTIDKNNILIGSSLTNGGIQVGNNISIGSNNIFEGGGGIIIGNNCKIGNNIKIFSTSHNYSKRSLPMTKLPVVIRDNVSIEDNCIILGDTTISEGIKLEKNRFIIKSV